VSARLAGLLELDVTVAWPDISAPWTALKQIRSVQAVPDSAVESLPPANEQPGPGSPQADTAEVEDSGGDAQ
jgi:hypothetical protein